MTQLIEGQEIVLDYSSDSTITIESAIEGWKILTPRERAKLVENIIKNPVERRAIALELAVLSGEDNRLTAYYLKRAYEFDKFLEEGRPEDAD